MRLPSRPRAIALLAAVALFAISILASCGRGQRRVLVLGFDGLDPVAVDLLISEGELPSFARL